MNGHTPGPRLIVQAVNAYDDLLGALQDATYKIAKMAEFFGLDKTK
jgi:hypothetical protein